MKKILAVIMSFVVALGVVLPVKALPSFVYNTKSDCYSESPAWHPSSLTGYDNSATKGYTGSSGYVIWKPDIAVSGKYRVLVWNVSHSGNVETLSGEVKDKNGVTPFLFQHKDVPAGLVEVGEFEFEAGQSGYVQINSSGEGGKYTRVNSVMFEMLPDEEGHTNMNADVPKTGEEVFAEHSYRDLIKKDVALPDITENTTVLYVAPDGNGDGTEAAPLSLKGAQEKVREIIKSGYPEGGIGVYLKGGTYSLDESFSFTAEDSGVEGNPVIWRSVPGEEVVITAGKVINKENISHLSDARIIKKIPAAAREKVLVADLSKEGIENIPEMDLKNSKPYVLLMGDKAGKTARWPNEGFGRTGNLIDTNSRDGSGFRKKGFTYDIKDPTALRWQDAKNAWMNGYWLTPYTIDYAKIAALDTDRLIIAGKQDNLLGAYGDARYWVENLIEELDNGGEWYLDSAENKLYYIPLEGYEDEEVSFVYKNFDLVEFKDASNVVLRGVKLRGGGQNGITFGKESSNCAMIGKEIVCVSGVGAEVSGKNNIVRDLDVSYTGAQGIHVNGGDEYKMIFGNNVVENNSVHDVGTGGGTKTGITIHGCGNKVINNHVYNILTQGISGGGMTHTIEYNIVERTNLEMGDTGAIYFINPCMGYGTKIRYNIVRDSVGILPIPNMTGDGALGIYLDNQSSGFDLTHNIMINMKEPALFSNGGRENKIINNVLIDCQEPIECFATASVKSSLHNKENIILYPFKEEPLKSMYPTLAKIDEEFNEENEYALGKYVVVKNNISYNGGEMNIKTVPDNGGVTENNVCTEIPEGVDLTDPFNIDFDEIRKQIPDFEDIPVAEIGVYTGGERTNTKEICFDNRADAFNITYPANGAVNVDPDVTLSWGYPKGGVQKAEIFVADNEEFQRLVEYNETTKMEYSAKLDYGKTYYWRVKAYPMLDYYEPRWNEGGIYTFTTMSAEDKLAGELALAEHLLEETVAGDGACEHSADARQKLEETMDVARNAKDLKEIKASIKAMQEAKDAYIASRKPNDNDVSTLVFDNYELDKIDERPLGLFMRSTMPLDGYVAKDPHDWENKVVRFHDKDKYYNFTNRYFVEQTGYVEAGTSVLPMQTDAACSITLLKSGIYPMESGTIYDSAAKVVFAGDGKIYADVNKKIPIMKYEEATWYDVLIKLNIKEKAYDVYINGELKTENVPMYDQGLVAVNQIVFDTLDGNASSSSLRGLFYIDDTVVKGSTKSTGRNPYLMDITVNGNSISEFEPGKFVYDINTEDAEIGWTEAEGANVKITDCDGQKIITVISGNCSKTAVYYIK